MAKRECSFPMGNLFFCIIFFFFFVFCLIGTGNGEGHSKKFYPEIDEPREYLIQIAIKFSGGGEIIMNRDYKIGQKEYSQGQVVNIEDLLAQLYGITGAKFVPNKEKSANVDLETKVKNAAKLEFEKSFYNIRVSEEPEDGGEDKAKAGKGKVIEFPIGKGQVPIHSFVDKLAKVDWRWHTTGKDEEKHRHVFQSHYTGHAMVTLSEKVVDPKNPNEEKLEEVARFHYNMLGLNLFKKRVRDERTGKDGVNVIVADDDAMAEGHKEFVEANRGLYTKSEFGKGVHLLTRRMTIREMEKIALKVIGGREWGGVFKCPHFVYNFVRSIIPKQSLDGLKSLENWPENMRVLDEGYKRTLGSYAFDESLELHSPTLLATQNYSGGDGKSGKLALTAAFVDVNANLGEKTKGSECVKFDEERVVWLNEVAKDGVVRGVDTLKPAEYESITREECDAKFPAETIKEFNKKVNSLVDRQTQLLNKHKEIGAAANHRNGLEHFLKQLKAEFMEAVGTGVAKNTGSLVIYAKRLFMEIFSAEGEAARLDVFAFMELPTWKPLKIAFEISKIQSNVIDQLINEDIWQQHLANRYPVHQDNDDENNDKQKDKNNNNKSQKDSMDNMEAINMRSAVIAGAGTNGLLAAFKLFYAGMDVDLVNDREEYTRTQMVIYDPNWMCTFRYFLGTKFMKIFNTPGFIHNECGYIGIHYVEQAMKERLEDLAKFVREKKNANNDDNDEAAHGKKMVTNNEQKHVREENQVGGQLDFHYGFTVSGLEETNKKLYKGFYAILNNAQGKLATLLPVDLFLCMGGTGDKLREKLLGSSPVPHSKPANYTTGIYRKVHNGRKINISPERNTFEMQKMRTELLAANFDKIIEKSVKLLPGDLHDGFQNLTQKLVDSEEANEFVFTENWAFFSLSAKTPKPLEALFKAIEQQKKYAGSNEKSKELLEQFCRRLRFKWAKAIFNFVYNDKVKKGGGHNTSTSAEQFRVNIDENGDRLPPNEVTEESGPSVDIVSIHSFNATVQMMENVAVERKPSAATGINSVVVAALGDALANTHFYTGGGMSIEPMSTIEMEGNQQQPEEPIKKNARIEECRKNAKPNEANLLVSDNEAMESALDLPNGRRHPLPLELNCEIFKCLKVPIQRKFIWGMGRDIYAIFRRKLLIKQINLLASSFA